MQDQVHYMQMLTVILKSMQMQSETPAKRRPRSVLESVVIRDMKRVLEPEPRGHSGCGRGRPLMDLFHRSENLLFSAAHNLTLFATQNTSSVS